jgi:hypothetical protein
MMANSNKSKPVCVQDGKLLPTTPIQNKNKSTAGKVLPPTPLPPKPPTKPNK